MSAGRDVERLISAWLTDEATDRSRDRVLVAVREAVDRMPQRRFRAAWREPMYISPLRLAGMAAVVSIAIAGAGLIGRATAPNQAGGHPSAAPSPVATEVMLESYRVARDAICERYEALVDPLKPQLDGIYDPELPEGDRLTKTAALAAIGDGFDAMIAELAALPVPAEIAEQHAENLADWNAVLRLIREAVGDVQAGDLVNAERMDRATDAFSEDIISFERSFRLKSCP